MFCFSPIGIHNRENPPAARQEKFDQYRNYNWARSSTSGQMRGIKTSFQEGVILRSKEDLLNTVDSIAENPTEVKVCNSLKIKILIEEHFSNLVL